MQYPKISEYVKASQDAGDNLDLSTKATAEELNEAIMDEFGVKYSKDGRKLLKAARNLDGTYSIKEGVKTICDNAFEGCTSLSSLVFPNSITRIGDSAFNGCESLSSVVIPDSVTSIGDGAFRGCDSLSEIVIPSSVTSIGTWAFRGCKSLTNIVLSDRITSIGDSAFYGCKSLCSLVISDSVTSIGNEAFRGCNIPTDLKQELSSRFGDKIFG